MTRTSRTAGPDRHGPRRRGFTVTEVVIAVFLLAIAMSTVVEILGSIAQARRAAERRQWATQEAANLMEHLTALPWGQINPESARGLSLSDEIGRKLPGPELAIDVDGPAAGDGAKPKLNLKRVALRLRWHDRAGGWEAPVRLTAWVAPQRSPR